MQSRKIVFITPTLGDGGSQWVMMQLCNYIVSKNLKVDLITLNSDGPYRNYLSKKVNIINLSKKKLRYAIFNLINIITKNKYSTVISSQNYINFSTILLFKIFSRNTKIIIRESNTISKFYRADNKIIYILEYLYRIFYNLADVIISPSNGVKKNLVKKFGIKKSKIQVIYNPVDIDLIYSLSKISIQNDDLKLFDKPTIISVGRLTYQKNLHFLIKCFSEINIKNNFNLIILGEGSKKKELNELILNLKQTNSIFLLGFKKNPFQYIIKSKALFLTSLWEGMPNVLIHALALKVPVVSFNCDSGPKEILNDGKYGELIDINDSTNLKIKIKEAIENKLKYRYPFPLFISNFSINKIGSKFVKLL